MTTLQDYINAEMLNWLRDNNLEYKLTSIEPGGGSLCCFCSRNFCIKLYDRIGHGFGVTVNVADKCDESLYDNDSFSLAWAFKYFEMNETAFFTTRTENDYQINLPKMIRDLKTIIPRLTELSSLKWASMKEWINNESQKQFA